MAVLCWDAEYCRPENIIKAYTFEAGATNYIEPSQHRVIYSSAMAILSALTLVRERLCLRSMPRGLVASGPDEKICHRHRAVDDPGTEPHLWLARDYPLSRSIPRANSS